MAHQVESMFFVGRTPWHGLGRELPQAPATVNEALEAAGLDWRVRLAPLYLGACADTGKLLFGGEDEHAFGPSALGPMVASKAVVRDSDSRVLGVVGARYKPLQNAEAFKAFQPFLDTGAARLETAGSLADGSRVWALARVTGTETEVAAGDETRGYILLAHGHDGSLAVRFGLTPIRVVCANTLALARGHQESSLFTIRHTSGAQAALDLVAELTGKVLSDYSATLASYRELARKRFSVADAEAYFRSVRGLPPKSAANDELSSRARNQQAELLRLFESGRGADIRSIRGTAWAAYNAVTEWLSFGHGHNDNTRVESLWFGDSATLNRRALDLALAA